MFLIQVENKEDILKVFGILSNNGRFIVIGEGKFRILEHGKEMIAKLEESKIKIKILENDVGE